MGLLIHKTFAGRQFPETRKYSIRFYHLSSLLVTQHEGYQLQDIVTACENTLPTGDMFAQWVSLLNSNL